MTLNEFKRKYENLSFEKYAAICRDMLHALPPDPEDFATREDFWKALQDFEYIAMVRLENGGR